MPSDLLSLKPTLDPGYPLIPGQMPPALQMAGGAERHGAGNGGAVVGGAVARHCQGGQEPRRWESRQCAEAGGSGQEQ